MHARRGRGRRGRRRIRRAQATDASRARRCAGVVIPPGVDGERFHPVDADDARRDPRAGSVSIPDRPLVLGVSRLVPRKGFDVVIDAVARTRRTCSSRSAGAGRDRARLERRARGDADVHFLGRVPDADLPALYACADVFAMCCRDRWRGLEAEGFGIVFLEAAACGVPAVAGRSGGSHEAVADGETGYVVAPRDVGAVRAAIAPAASTTPTLRGADGRGRAAPGRRASSRTTGSSTRLAPVAAGRPLGRRTASAGSLR